MNKYNAITKPSQYDKLNGRLGDALHRHLSFGNIRLIQGGEAVTTTTGVACGTRRYFNRYHIFITGTFATLLLPEEGHDDRDVKLFTFFPFTFFFFLRAIAQVF